MSKYAGNTSGSFQVNANGCAAYSIPIAVPPGTRGVAPSLSLEYASAGSQPDSIIGLGWNLRGLSSITRSPATMAQDGFIRAVAFDRDDRYVLDGARLQPVGGQYGDPAAVYHTEVEMWKQIKPQQLSSDTNGPRGFQVNEKDGSILEYGMSPDSQVPFSADNSAIRIWALNRLTDPNGNSMSIHYSIDAANSAHYPARIEYTSNGEMKAQRLVEFTYEDRPDCMPRYIGGCRVNYTQRLTGIRTSVQGQRVRTYSLEYRQGQSTGRSQLVSVTESDAAGNSLPATQFAWQDGNPGVFGSSTSQPIGELMQGGTWLPADVNGDGLVDVVYAEAFQGALQLTLLINTANGFVASPSLLVPELSFPGGTLLPMDMSADGLMRIVYGSQCTGPSGSLQLGLTIFTAVPDSASQSGFRLQAGPINGSGPDGLAPGGGLVAMDVNGDGLADIVYLQTYDGAHVALTTLLSDGTRFVFSSSLQTEFSAGGQPLPLDVDGDGMTDLLYAYAEGTTLKFALFRSIWGKGLVQDPVSPVSEGVPLTAGGSLLPFDINADGLGDFVYATQASDGQSLELFTFLSNGVSFELQNGGSSETYDFQFGGKLLPMDVNGDGLCELILSNQSGDFGTSINLSLLQFTGTGWAIPKASVNQALTDFTWGGDFVPVDLKGIGKTGIVYAYGVTDLQFAFAPPSGPFPDLVSEIANGLGARFAITYKPLTDPSVYSRTDSGSAHIDAQGLLSNLVSGSSFSLIPNGAITPGSPGATFASRTVDFPKYVVAEHVLQDGRGSNYTFEHFYRGAKIDLGGRGWLGYSSVQSTDKSAECVHDTTYSQVFPTSFLATDVKVFTLAGDLLTETLTTYSSTAPAPWPQSAVRVPQADHSITRHYTAGKTAADREDRSAYSYDDYGNRTQMAEEGTGFPGPLFTFDSFENRQDAWLLGLKVESKQCSDAAGKQVLTWEKISYDHRGQPISHSIWDDQRDGWEATTQVFDDWGNVVSSTTPWNATTDFSFDPIYHGFCIKTTIPPNANGVRMETQTEYDPRFGTKVREVDANGVVHEFHHDGLGRLVETLGPNATGDLVTLTTHEWLQQDGVYYEQTRSRVDWAGTNWSWSRKYLDGLGRTWREETLHASGSGSVAVDKELDSRGLLLSSSLPYLTSGKASVFMTYTFDALGRLTRSHLPLSQGEFITIANEWRGTDHMVEIQGVGTPEARISETEFGGFGEKQFVRKRIAADGGETTYEYDALKRLISATDPGGIVTASRYDSQHRIVASSVSGNGKVYRSEEFAFDDTHQSSSVRNALGETKTTARDLLGRPSTRTVTASDGSSYTLTYTYDGATAYSMGRLMSISRSDGLFSYAWEYDAAGNQTKTTLRLRGEEYLSQTSYTPARQPDQVSLPDGAIHRYQYTPGGLLGSISLEHENATIAGADFTDFNAQQIPATVHYGNGVVERNTYDATGRLTQQRITARNGQDSLVASLSRNQFDQIIALNDPSGGGSSQTFTYDRAGRIQSAAGPYGTEHYVYDKGGNILAKGGVDFQYDGQQVVAGTSGGEAVYSASYDAMGKMTQRTLSGKTQVFHYDAEERLLSDGAGQYAYDHNGSRIYKDSQGVVTFYVSAHFEVTTFPNGARQRTRYLGGGFGASASSTVVESSIEPPKVAGVPAVGVEYLHSDQLGSTRLTTNDEGESAADALYQPFGALHVAESEDTFRQKFTGQELDFSGLYYFQARYFDPFTGRFISSDDRSGASIYVADALNRYAYVLNDPLSETDPSGHSIWDLIGQLVVSAVAIAVGAAITPFSGALGGALVGAGISGGIFALQMMVTGQANTGSSTQQWNAFGIQFGIGAATGLVTGGIGRIGSRMLGEVPDIAAGRWANFYERAGINAAREDLFVSASRTGRIALSAGFGFVAGGTGGVLQQVLENAAHNANPLGLANQEHYDLSRGVGLAFLVGAATGAAAGAYQRSAIEDRTLNGRIPFGDRDRVVFGAPVVGGVRARAGAISGVAGRAPTTWETMGAYVKVGWNYSLKSSFLAAGRTAMYFALPNWPFQNW